MDWDDKQSENVRIFPCSYPVDERDGSFQLLQIIAAYLFMKIHQYLMPAPTIERQSEGVL
jgi:hypothetical protein